MNNTLITYKKLTLSAFLLSLTIPCTQIRNSINRFSYNTFQISVLLALLTLAKCSPLESQLSANQFENNQRPQENVLMVNLFPNGTFDPLECSQDLDCQVYQKAMCKENQCYCKPNYRFERVSKDSIICSFFRCKEDAECQDWDPNMTCTSEQTCACRKDFFSNHYDRKCVQMATGFNWLLYLTIIPILLVVALSVYLCIRLGRSSSKSLRERATNFKRRMSRKLSVIAGVNSKNSSANDSNNNNISSIHNHSNGKDHGKLPQAFTQTDM